MIALVLNVLSSLFLIVFILLHSGKGSGLSDMSPMHAGSHTRRRTSSWNGAPLVRSAINASTT